MSNDIPILIDHDMFVPPVGTIKIQEDLELFLTLGGYHLEPGFIVEESHVDENGVTVYDKVRLVEMSIVKNKE